MHTVSFVPAHVHGAVQALSNLEVEYLSWVQQEMRDCFPNHARATALAMLGSDPSPHEARYRAQPTWSRFYLIEVAGQAAGMCGIRMLSSGATEVKRLYVRTGFRGMRLGSLAMERLLADTRSVGRTQLLLDSAPFMKSAHRLYEAHGFADCPAYEGTEAPVALHGQWKFMKKNLRTSGA